MTNTKTTIKHPTNGNTITFYIREGSNLVSVNHSAGDSYSQWKSQARDTYRWYINHGWAKA